MFKNLRKIVIIGVALMGAVVAHGATTRYVELRSTLQPNTTGLNAINVSSGTILDFRASTATIGALTTTTLTPGTITGLVTNKSTTTYSGAQTMSSATITAATIGTLNGVLTDNTTAAHNGAHTFSTMTVTSAAIAEMTGVTVDRSSWTHSGTHAFNTMTASSENVTIFSANVATVTAVYTNQISTQSGSGGVGIRGSATNDNAADGNYGQYISTFITTTVNFPASGTFGHIVSTLVPVGDWSLRGTVFMDNNTSTAITGFIIGISTNAGSFTTDLVLGQNRTDFAGASGGWQLTNHVVDFRVSLAVPTNYYLKYQATYASGQPKANGILTATRRR